MNREQSYSTHIATATEATDFVIATPPFTCKILSIRARFSAASTSGTLQVRKTPDGTAVGSGTAMLTTTMDLSGTPDTNVEGVFDRRQILFGESIGIEFAGTLTSLADLDITVTVRRLGVTK